MDELALKHFYIPDDQSVYLLSHKDAKKLKNWFKLCESQLRKLGYTDIELIGKGAFGFAFSGISQQGEAHVFKFSKVTLPQHIQDRLEEEAYMLGRVKHALVPQLIEFQKIKRQSILVMERGPGDDLEQYSLQHGPLPVPEVVAILVQVCEILVYLRQHKENGSAKPIVHGDVKPSNLVWDETTQTVSLIDWGSCVFAQIDQHRQYVAGNVMDLMSGDLQQTNARLGDVYFIGDEQLNGALSSPRFDEQGLASTIYALASGQSSRFGRKVITPLSLGLPKALAQCLQAMMSDDVTERDRGGDWLLNNYQHFKRMVFAPPKADEKICMLPTWISGTKKDIETVVYSSRKSFLRQQSGINPEHLHYLNDAQFERYYKNYLQGMGETEKAFISSVSRLGKYPVVGGLAVRWEADGIYVDSSLKLYDPSLQVSFDRSVDNMITLARAINRTGIFKSCMFNAKNTLHFERNDERKPFTAPSSVEIPYELSRVSIEKNESRMHSYFEDGDDPDELLKLPERLLDCLKQLNSIHHTGCIIFEALPKHLKIHNYYTLLDHTREQEFTELLRQIIQQISDINGLGISGFMKLPYKDTRTFAYQGALAHEFYPRNPYQDEQN
ncbi:protein kinase [Glaciecola sp. XM2]|uniref:serine/threonine protein kinase n=1 Tax=Glaciecola sp. XM2 TaxID=1914931 RepID=UPI001BDEC7AB|nr:protein kinase [Glaciecola sp. XM2]MBT1449538.1 protein kinase [Glaciecola sp. XM2]